MNGSEEGNKLEQQEIMSFSNVVLIEMKKKYIGHLLGLVIPIIGIYVISFVMSLTVLSYYKNLFVSHDENLFQEAMQQQLKTAGYIIDQVGEHYLSALTALARVDVIGKYLKNSFSTFNDDFLMQQFYLFSGKENLDFLFVMTPDGQIVYANNDFNRGSFILQNHHLVSEALEGRSSQQLELETREWISQAGLTSLINKKADHDRQKKQSKAADTDPVLCLEACTPVFDGEKVIGVLFGGVLMNNNSSFIEKIRHTLSTRNQMESYLSIIVRENRVASSFVAGKGYLENTSVTLNFRDHQIDKDIDFQADVDIMNKRYFAAYYPIRSNDLKICAILEIGYDQAALFRSSLDFFDLVRKRIIVLLLITSIIAALIIRFLTNRFSKSLFVSLNTMANKISLLINKMADVSRHINLTSTEILSSSKEQAAYFDQQAASISETTATMEELATVTKQILNNAEQVVKVTEQTSANAENGYNSVLDTIKSMKEIKDKNETSAQEIIALGEKSQKIGQVMRIITGIASKTKLIAFNASIEASAAGEIGKRFSVVAAEVRRLAEDTVKSTEIIKKLISEIQKSTNRLVFVSEEETKKIDEGVHLSEVSGDSLKGILQIVNKSIQSAKQISLITQQQKTASDQVVSHLKEISIGAGESVKSSKHINNVILQLEVLSKDLNALVDESTHVVEKKEIAKTDK